MFREHLFNDDNLKCIKQLYQENPKFIQIISNGIFFQLLKNNRLHIIIWLYNIKHRHDNLIILFSDQHILYLKTEILITVIESGSLDVMKWLILKYSLISTGDEYSHFSHACTFGHLHMAQWILETNPNININTNKAMFNHLFYCVCNYGYLHIAQWLLKISPTIDINYNSVFNKACHNKHLELAKWLYNTSLTKGCEFDIKIKVKAFNNACLCKHSKVAEWLYTLIPHLANLTIINEKIISYTVITEDMIQRYMSRIAFVFATEKTTDINIKRLSTDVIRYICKFV